MNTRRNHGVFHWLHVVAVMCLVGASLGGAPPAKGGESGQAPTLATAQAPSGLEAAALLDPDHAAWDEAPESILHLNRTPPLYSGGPDDDGTRPEATAQLLRLVDGRVVVRLRWTDPTQDLAGKTPRFPDGGEPQIYKHHSEGVARFADAACVMVPRKQGPRTHFPSMMMGDAKDPMDLFFWRAGSGFSQLRSAGRATPQPTGAAAAGRVAWVDGRWTAVFQLPAVASRTPLCFALWDGHRQDRDGLKYFSLWYEIE